MAKASLLKRMASAGTRENAPFLGPGKYTLEVDNAKIFSGKNGDDFFVVTFEVQEASHSSKNEVGSSACYLSKLTDPWGLGMRNTNTFLECATGESSEAFEEVMPLYTFIDCSGMQDSGGRPEQYEDEKGEWHDYPSAVSKLAGTIMKCEVYSKPNKTDPSKMHDEHIWTLIKISDEMQAYIKALADK